MLGPRGEHKNSATTAYGSHGSPDGGSTVDGTTATTANVVDGEVLNIPEERGAGSMGMVLK